MRTILAVLMGGFFISANADTFMVKPIGPNATVRLVLGQYPCAEPNFYKAAYQTIDGKYTRACWTEQGNSILVFAEGEDKPTKHNKTDFGMVEID